MNIPTEPGNLKFKLTIVCERKTSPTRILERFKPKTREFSVILKLPNVSKIFPLGERREKKIMLKEIKIDGKILMRFLFDFASMKNMITKIHCIIGRK